MDFFEHQDQARRRTQTLVLLFVLTIGALIAAIYVTISFLFGSTIGGRPGSGGWRVDILLGVAAGTIAIVGLGTLYKQRQLRRGGPAVAELLGGRRVDLAPEDPGERRLVNVVEEMAIASGVPVPPVFVMDQEAGINAFAAGLTQPDAVVAVSRGATEHLTRDELQGVVAHEFSHILNGDMQLNVRLMGVVHGILVIALIGRGLLYSSGRSSRSRRGGGSGALLGIALYVIGGVGVFFGRVIKSAVSREREYLADASAVQFTRHPAGLAGALKKIAIPSHGSRLHHPKAEEASHMFFSNGLAKSWFSWMATHPPLAERIARIDPSYDGSLSVDTATLQAPNESLPLAGLASAVPAAPLLDRVGTVSADDVAGAHALLAQLPESLRSAARHAESAMLLMYALLLEKNPERRSRQMETLSLSGEQHHQLLELLRDLENVNEASRLPLAELSAPALVGLDDPAFDTVLEHIRQLVTADARTTLFEYAVQRLLRDQREALTTKATPAAFGHLRLRPLRDECVVLLASLAHTGADEDLAARAAYRRGADALDVGIDPENMPSSSRTTLRDVDRALERLAMLTPNAKRRLFSGLVAVAERDGEIDASEMNLLRVTALALRIPVPLSLAADERRV